MGLAAGRWPGKCERRTWFPTGMRYLGYGGKKSGRILENPGGLADLLLTGQHRSGKLRAAERLRSLLCEMHPTPASVAARLFSTGGRDD